MGIRGAWEASEMVRMDLQRPGKASEVAGLAPSSEVAHRALEMKYDLGRRAKADMWIRLKTREWKLPRK